MAVYTVVNVALKDLKATLDAIDIATRTVVAVLPGSAKGTVTVVSKL